MRKLGLTLALAGIFAGAGGAFTASQTIGFLSIPDQILGGPPFQLAASASSGLPVTFVVSTSAAGVCRSASGLVMLLKPGLCTITATQKGNSSFAAASETQSFQVNQASPPVVPTGVGAPIPISGNPVAIALGYLYQPAPGGSNTLDFVVADSAGSTVSALASNGTGFSQFKGSPFAIPGSGVLRAVALADFNADGNVDIVTVADDGSVTVLPFNRKGTFGPAQVASVSAGQGSGPLVVGDFNADGNPDVAVLNLLHNNVTVLLGDGAGSFTAAPGSPFSTGTPPASIAVGDFNGDGFQDLVVTSSSTAQGAVLLGDGTGAFTFIPLLQQLPHSSSVAVADFNGDGIPDLAIGYATVNTVLVLLGNGQGGFQPDIQTTVIGLTGNIAVGDLDGDGLPDIAVATTTGVVVLLNQSSAASFVAQAPIPINLGAVHVALALADFNGDGVLDIAAMSGIGASVTILGGQSSTTSVLSTGASPPIYVGQPLTFTLTVTHDGSSFAVPTGTATLYDGSQAIATNSQSGLPFTFSANLAAGSHTLSANYLGDPASLPSTSNPIYITVVLEPQTIYFGPLSDRPHNSPPFAIAATSDSGLPVSFSATPDLVCTVSGNQVTVLDVGVCSITASQAGNGVYSPATPVTQSFLVAGSGQNDAVLLYDSIGPPGSLFSNQFKVEYSTDPFSTVASAVAFTFTPSSTAGFLELDIELGGAPLTVELMADLYGPVLRSWQTGAGACCGLVKFQGDGSIPLVAGTTYWVYVTTSDTGFVGLSPSKSSSQAYLPAFVSGSSWQMQYGPTAALSVQGVATFSPCDIRNTGTVDVVDVQRLIQQAGNSTPAVNDLDGDGNVNAVDAGIELNAALGLGCSTVFSARSISRPALRSGTPPPQITRSRAR